MSFRDELVEQGVVMHSAHPMTDLGRSVRSWTLLGREEIDNTDEDDNVHKDVFEEHRQARSHAKLQRRVSVMDIIKEKKK